jgi:hypothetical protein
MPVVSAEDDSRHDPELTWTHDDGGYIMLREVRGQDGSNGWQQCDPVHVNHQEDCWPRHVLGMVDETTMVSAAKGSQKSMICLQIRGVQTRLHQPVRPLALHSNPRSWPKRSPARRT